MILSHPDPSSRFEHAICSSSRGGKKCPMPRLSRSPEGLSVILRPRTCLLDSSYSSHSRQPVSPAPSTSSQPFLLPCFHLFLLKSLGCSRKPHSGQSSTLIISIIRVSSSKRKTRSGPWSNALPSGGRKSVGLSQCVDALSPSFSQSRPFFCHTP